jgi:hypothetical protein
MSRLLRLLPIGIAMMAALGISCPVAAASTSTRCQTRVYRQFDFWLGDWDTFDHGATGKPSIARNHVNAILGGCVLHEVYEQTDGLTGQSFTIYDADRHVWHQTWVTNHGQLLVLEGSLLGSSIVLDGIDHGDHDATIRVSWEKQGDGVREVARKSHDGGTSWQPLFDILFRPHHA